MSVEIGEQQNKQEGTRNEIRTILHVYGQFSRRGPAAIVGTRAALIALRQAIDAALMAGAASVTASAADGEVYTIGIECDDTPITGNTWSLRAVPYAASYAEESRHDAIWPAVLSP